MKVIIKEPFGDFKETEVPNELKPLQDLVGGHIEFYSVYPGLGLLVNEDGLFSDLKFNFKFEMQQLFGNVVFIGTDGEEFADCPVTLKGIEDLLALDTMCRRCENIEVCCASGCEPKRRLMSLIMEGGYAQC